MISVLSILGVGGSTEKHFVKIKRYTEWTQWLASRGYSTERENNN